MRQLDISSMGLGAKASICWSFFWRGILITMASMIVAGILGGLLGFVVAVAGTSKQAAQPLILFGGFGVGLLSGAVSLYLYIRWLLSSRLGRFRLVLVPAGEAAPLPQRS